MTVDSRIAAWVEPTSPVSTVPAALSSDSTVGLPRTDHLAAPSHAFLNALLGPLRAVVRSAWRVDVHGAEHVPAQGPVILAANHIATMDGPLSVLTSPRRPTFALGKSELFSGVVGELLLRAGQIPVDRDVVVDRTAIDRCIRVLREGHALAIFPEGMRDTGEFRWIRSGAAYLAMVTGAPIVPVAMLGTRRAGDSPRSTPKLRSQMHVVYGAPLHVPWMDWPRRQYDVRQVSERLRVQLAAHVRQAEELTGMRLPGVPANRIAAD